jgi:hypothetical protein
VGAASHSAELAPAKKLDWLKLAHGVKAPRHISPIPMDCKHTGRLLSRRAITLRYFTSLCSDSLSPRVRCPTIRSTHCKLIGLFHSMHSADSLPSVFHDELAYSQIFFDFSSTQQMNVNIPQLNQSNIRAHETLRCYWSSPVTATESARLNLPFSSYIVSYIVWVVRMTYSIG